MENGIHKIVPIEAIKIVEGFNPPERTEAVKIRDLQKSIKEHGVLVDLLVTADMSLVDGHRRYAAAKALGITTVPVKVVEGEYKELWAEVNATQRRPNGRGWMHVALQGAPIKDGVTKRHYDLLVDLIGQEGVRWLIQRRVSPGIWDACRRVALYAGRTEDREFMRKTVFWLVDHKAQLLINSAIDTGIAPGFLVQAIENDLALWDVAPKHGEVHTTIP